MSVDQPNGQDLASRSQAVRDRINAGIALAKKRRPDGYDWGRAGRGDGSPEVIQADAAETELEDRIAEFVAGTDDEMALSADFNAWLKTLRV